MRKLWDCGFPAAVQVHSCQNPDNDVLCLPGVHGKQRLESRCPMATHLCTRASVRVILTAVHSGQTGVHGKQRLESRCPIATHLCTRTSVRSILIAVHTGLTAVHPSLTAVHTCQTTVHRCVSYGTAAFQPQLRCTAVKHLTVTRFFMPGVHGKQRLESRCPIATHLCTRISVRESLTVVHSS